MLRSLVGSEMCIRDSTSATLVVAMYFWSPAGNCFSFHGGPATVILLDLYVLLGISPCTRPIRSDTVQLKSETSKLYPVMNKNNLKKYISTHSKLDFDVSKEEH